MGKENKRERRKRETLNEGKKRAVWRETEEGTREGERKVNQGTSEETGRVREERERDGREGSELREQRGEKIMGREKGRKEQEKSILCGENNPREGERVGPSAQSLSALWTETPKSTRDPAANQPVTWGRSFSCVGLSFLAVKWDCSHLPSRGTAGGMAQGDRQLEPPGALNNIDA